MVGIVAVKILFTTVLPRYRVSAPQVSDSRNFWMRGYGCWEIVLKDPCSKQYGHDTLLSPERIIVLKQRLLSGPQREVGEAKRPFSLSQSRR